MPQQPISLRHFFVSPREVAAPLGPSRRSRCRRTRSRVPIRPHRPQCPRAHPVTTAGEARSTRGTSRPAARPNAVRLTRRRDTCVTSNGDVPMRCRKTMSIPCNQLVGHRRDEPYSRHVQKQTEESPRPSAAHQCSCEPATASIGAIALDQVRRRLHIPRWSARTHRDHPAPGRAGSGRLRRRDA